MRTRPTLERLLRQLEHGTESDAYEAAKLLAGVKGKTLIAALDRVLRSGDRPNSREAAAYALSWPEDRKAAEPLLRCAADPNEQDSVRGQAIEGLANHQHRASLRSGLRLKTEELMLRLLDSPSPTLRFWACYGLGSLRTQRAIPRLRKLVREDTSLCPGRWYVREEAEDALEWIASRPGKNRTPVHLKKAAARARRSEARPAAAVPIAASRDRRR